VAAPAHGPGTDPIEVTPVVVLSQVFPARPSSIPDIREFVRRCLSESPLTDEGNREVGETVFRALLDAAGPTGSIQVAFRIFPEHVEVDVLHSDTWIQAHPAARPQASRFNGADAAAPAVRPGPAGPAVTAGPAAPGAPGTPAAPGIPGAPGTQAAPVAPAAAADRGTPPEAAASPGPAEPPAWPASTSPVSPASAEPIAPTPAEPVPLGKPGQPATFAEWMSTALRREGLTQEAAARQLGVSVKTVSRWVGGATEPRLRDLRRIQELLGQVPFT